MKTAPSRIIFVDLLRSFAVLLITFSHASLAFDTWAILRESNTDIYYLTRFLTRAATPTFLFIFGMMVEMVYARKVEEQGLKQTSKRLLQRSIQCYIAYAIAVIALLFNNLQNTSKVVDRLLFLSGTPLADILKIYTVLLLLLIPLLHLRRRIGLVYTAFIVIVAAWLPKIIIKDAYTFQDENIAYVTSFLFGIGGSVGPSVLQGLTMVAFGMLLGSTLRKENIVNTQLYFRRITENIIIAFLMLVTIESTTPMKQMIKNYVDINIYRNLNHPGYYAIGLLWVSVLALIFAAVFPALKTKKIKPIYTLLGKYSLLSFTVGIIIVNAIRPRVVIADLSHTVLLNMVLIFVVVSIVYVYDRWFQEIILKILKIRMRI